MNEHDNSRSQPEKGRREPLVDGQELVPIYALYDEGLAEVLRVALEEEGIPCHIENSHQAGLTGILQVRLFVRAQDADRAARVLQKLGHQTEGPGDVS